MNPSPPVIRTFFAIANVSELLRDFSSSHHFSFMGKTRE
jgi:hypothetical protein